MAGTDGKPAWKTMAKPRPGHGQGGLKPVQEEELTRVPLQQSPANTREAEQQHEVLP